MSNFHCNRLENIYLLDCVSYCSCDITMIVANMIFSTQRKIEIYKGKNLVVLYSLRIRFDFRIEFKINLILIQVLLNGTEMDDFN